MRYYDQAVGSIVSRVTNDTEVFRYVYPCDFRYFSECY